MKAVLIFEPPGKAITIDELGVLVVKDDFDQPIAVVAHIDEGGVILARAGEELFDKIIKSYGRVTFDVDVEKVKA